MSLTQIKQNDRRPYATKELGFDLSDVSGITFKMRLRGKIDLTVNSAAVITDESAGSIEYRWAAGDTILPGLYNNEWEVLFSDGTTQTFPTLPVDVVLILSDLDN